MKEEDCLPMKNTNDNFSDSEIQLNLNLVSIYCMSLVVLIIKLNKF